MDIQTLKNHLQSIANIPNSEWLASLNDRKRKELEFHNRDRDVQLMKVLDQDTYDKYYANKKFYRTVKKSTEYVEKWIRQNARERVFLDYACGNGGNAIKAAQAGAAMAIGFDISDISVRNAQRDAERFGLLNTFFFQADAENTHLPDRCIDTIICSGMLHHLDLSFAFPELRRILAPGGKILAVEALDYNLITKVYRMMTPDMRTEWEKSHILSLKDLQFARYFFNIGKINFWHITSYAGAFNMRLLPLFNTIDHFLTKIPVIRLMAWIFTFELISKEAK